LARLFGRSAWLALAAGLTTLLAYLAHLGHESVTHAPNRHAAENAPLHYAICAIIAACAVRLTPGYSALNVLLNCALRETPRPLPTGPWLAWQGLKVGALIVLLHGFPTVPVVHWIASGNPARVVLALGILLGPPFKVRAAMLLLSHLASAALDAQEYANDRELLESAMISHGLRIAAVVLGIATVTLATYPIISMYLLPLLAFLAALSLHLWSQSRLPWREYRQLSGLIDRIKRGLILAVALLPTVPVLDLLTGVPTELTIHAWATMVGEAVLQPHSVKLDPASYLTQTPAQLSRAWSAGRSPVWGVTGDRLQVVVSDGRGHGWVIDPRSGAIRGTLKVPIEAIERQEDALRRAFPYLRPGAPVLRDGRVRVSAWIVADVWLPFLGFTLALPVSGDPALPRNEWGLAWYPARWRGRLVPVLIPIETLAMPVLEVPGEALVSIPPPRSLKLWLHGPGFVRIDRGRVILLRPEYRSDGTLKRLEAIRV